MSTDKRRNHRFLQNSEKVSMVATAAAVILLTIAVLVGYCWGFSDARNSGSNNSSTPNDSDNLVSDSAPLPPFPPSPPVIYAYSGEITSIEGETIHIKTTAQENGVPVEKDLKVSVSNNTQYSKLDISTPPAAPGSGEQAEREKTIQLNEIQVGDRIIARADENIKDKTEFQAIKITVLVSGL